MAACWPVLVGIPAGCNTREAVAVGEWTYCLSSPERSRLRASTGTDRWRVHDRPRPPSSVHSSRSPTSTRSSYPPRSTCTVNDPWGTTRCSRLSTGPPIRMSPGPRKARGITHRSVTRTANSSGPDAIVTTIEHADPERPSALQRKSGPSRSSRSTSAASSSWRMNSTCSSAAAALRRASVTCCCAAVACRWASRAWASAVLAARRAEAPCQMATAAPPMATIGLANAIQFAASICGNLRRLG